MMKCVSSIRVVFPGYNSVRRTRIDDGLACLAFKFREDTACVFMVPCVHLARVYVLLSANDENISSPCFATSFLALNAHFQWHFPPFRTVMSRRHGHGPERFPTLSREVLFFPRRFHFPSVLWELMFRNRHTYTQQCVRACFKLSPSNLYDVVHIHCVSNYFSSVVLSLRKPPPTSWYPPSLLDLLFYLHSPTLMEGGAASRRPRPILVITTIILCSTRATIEVVSSFCLKCVVNDGAP